MTISANMKLHICPYDASFSCHSVIFVNFHILDVVHVEMQVCGNEEEPFNVVATGRSADA